MENQFITIFAAGRRRLVRLSDIIEIVPMMALEKIDVQQGNCRGLANLRGEIIPVFDLSGNDAPLSPSRFIIITHLEQTPIGLIADEIYDVVTVPAENIASRPIGEDVSLLVARIEESLILILEPSDVIHNYR
jgi:purine-binding chemotaxis protein CheW